MLKCLLKGILLGGLLLVMPFAKANVLSSSSPKKAADISQAAPTNPNNIVEAPVANEEPITAQTASIQPAATYNIDAEAQKLSLQAQNLDPQIIKLGLAAYLKARGEGLDPQQILTIVDYHQPSTNARLFVFDLKHDNLLFKELVAHGKNSGENYSTSFSDSPSSLKSSLGVYLTQNTYVGHHGYSLRLAGLEKGFNDMAAARAIVVHAADYVNQAFARAHGRLGKSWGCFAVDPAVAGSLINTIKNGSLLFAYYPDRNYLSNSAFIQG